MAFLNNGLKKKVLFYFKLSAIRMIQRNSFGIFVSFKPEQTPSILFPLSNLISSS
jgi:hypothetical protein